MFVLVFLRTALYLMSRSDESAHFTGHNGEEANAVCHKPYCAAFLLPDPGFGIILH